MTIRCRYMPEVCEISYNLLIKSFILLVFIMVVLIMMPTPIHAAMNVQNQDMDIGAHDYIMDKQQPYNCSMVQMNDNELSNVTAAGFSSFTLQDGVTRAYLDIQSSTFTEIQSLKLGYYDCIGDGTGFGWDQDWTNVSLGSATQDLQCNGLYIQANFTNIANSATRVLNSLTVGTPSMTGPISANFNSFSGLIETGGSPGTENTQGTAGTVVFQGYRANLGQSTITSTNSEFYMQLSVSGPQKGWYFYWNNATLTHP